jgi:putative thioredoxin
MILGSDGMSARAGADGSAAGNSGAAIFDCTTAEFEQKVIMASMERPVIVDFWAPWCGPCKQLGPALEAAVTAANGKVAMAKIDIDQNPELAQALRIQSVPTVYAFFQGRPVDAFQGARPAGDIKAFIDKLLAAAKQALPDAPDVPATLAAAAQALAEGRAMEAQELYGGLLLFDGANAAAYAGLVRTFLAGGELEQAQEMIEQAPPEIAAHKDFTAAKTALEIAQGAAGASGDAAKLEAEVARNPADLDARYRLSEALFAAGRREEAVDALIEIVRRNRAWEEEKARLQLLRLFEAMGPADPVTLAGRRKLSSVLFS